MTGHDSVAIALFRAAFCGDGAAARQLLDARAAVDSMDAFENTPLLIAAYRGHVEIAKDLLDHGAAIDHRNCTGDTALLLAAAYPIRLAEPYGRPAARQKGHDETVRELLARGAATHYRNLDDESAIELAGRRAMSRPRWICWRMARPSTPRTTLKATRCIGLQRKAMPRWRRPCSIAALRQTAHRATARRP
jgi:hypothetical protein